MICIQSSAQPHFTVTFIKGKVELKSKKRWINLESSRRLTRADEIRVDRDAALHMVDSAGVPIIVALPGIYNIGDIQDNSRTSQVLTHDGRIVSAKVVRVKQNFLGSEAPIKVLLPTDSTFATVYAKKIVVRWIDKGSKGPYIVTVKTRFKETIATYEIPGVEMSFDLFEERFLKDRVFYFIVSSKSDPKYKSVEHVAKRILIHERFRIDDILNKEIILDNSRALDQLVLAGFFEDKALFADAVNAYLEAIRLGGDDTAYTEAFFIFLKRYGLVLDQ